MTHHCPLSCRSRLETTSSALGWSQAHLGGTCGNTSGIRGVHAAGVSDFESLEVQNQALSHCLQESWSASLPDDGLQSASSASVFCCMTSACCPRTNEQTVLRFSLSPVLRLACSSAFSLRRVHWSCQRSLLESCGLRQRGRDKASHRCRARGFFQQTRQSPQQLA